ncbi:MAG: Cell division protein DivIC (FtsB), stabilizes FtsL against RasP cleavage [uncultured Segetibacter sp.]|uniref:Cell division protein DivIC (FtsB), stabilizes FtsL against RasP cleavage n=1 Tax=uncultured Segetibacter sp. TaxID=481133 RepID=A0A6J4TLW7_9BACT|nr:MAG: Cell division protein DivIC (FtsB), stabilizes FtsL against RasP cleavage [uncultured Segetibacter sp.]
MRIPNFIRSFYFLATVIFLVWMFFFDSNDFLTQYQMSRKLSDLEEDKEYYVQKIAEVQKDRTELMSNSELLEKYAREKYYMKRPGEEVFIIVKKPVEK